MIELIEQHIENIESLLINNLPESKYQFELYDLGTNTRHFRGLDEQFHWGSIYEMFVVAEVIKTSEEGNYQLGDNLILHKNKFKNGNGILKHFTNLEQLTIIDACKMVISTSDNLCADELLDIVGLDKLNSLFRKSGCQNLKLSDNLDSLVGKLFASVPMEVSGSFIYSNEFHNYYADKLQTILKFNYCRATDINTCFNYILYNYLTDNGRNLFIDCLLGNNVWTRLNYYSYFSPFILKGKTGLLGFGIVNNETVAIINKSNSKIMGYFTLVTKDNPYRYFKVNDVFGLIGLELTDLYEQYNG